MSPIRVELVKMSDQYEQKRIKLKKYKEAFNCQLQEQIRKKEHD